MKTKTQSIFELSAPYNNHSQGQYTRALFVCSAGLLRSATAAAIGSELGMNTRACGSESYALVPISVNLINWANKIYFVNLYNFIAAKHTFFEDQDTYSQLVEKSVIWEIEDIYNYRDPKLVQIITELLT